MADLHFTLVTPERQMMSDDVHMVVVPGTEGEFGVMAGHAPAVIALRPGIMSVTTAGKTEKIIVLGGLAEVSDKGLTVLADVATSLSDLDREAFARNIVEMEEQLSVHEGNALDRAIERLDQFKVIQQNVTSTAMH